MQLKLKLRSVYNVNDEQVKLIRVNAIHPPHFRKSYVEYTFVNKKGRYIRTNDIGKIKTI